MALPTSFFVKNVMEAPVTTRMKRMRTMILERSDGSMVDSVPENGG
jgi:hypothetical protein